MVRIWVLALSFATAAALWVAPPAFAFGDCESEGYIATFDSNLGARTCEEIASFDVRFSGRTVRMRVIRPVGSAHGDDTRWIANVGALARSIGPAMDAIGGLDIAQVSVLLADIAYSGEGGDGVHEVADGRSPTTRSVASECRVVIYKIGGASVPTEEFLFTYAHELFHCIQHKTWFSKSAYLRAASWWVEGSAEYFANLVKPDANFSAENIAEFDTKSLKTSMVDLDYANVVPFFWLAQDGGPSAVRTLIQAMPDAEGRDAQLAALRTRWPLERWLRFGEAYFDGRITRPGGRRLARPTQMLDGVTVRRSVRVPLTVDAAYALARRNVTFDRGTTYALSVQEPTGGVRSRMSEGSGAWSEPPPRVAACRGTKTYRALTTSIEGPARHVLAVDASPPMQEAACCLVGDWAPTRTALDETARVQNMIGASMGAGKVSTVCRHVGGTWQLTFNRDNTGRLQWKDFSNECKATKLTGARGDIVTLARTNGATDFAWRNDERATIITYKSTTVHGTMKMSMGGRQILQRTIPIDLPRGPHGMAEECHDTSLRVGSFGGLTANATHTRIGDAPP